MKNVLNYKTILEKIKEEIEKKKTISELKKLELYDEIFDLYGQKAYLNSVPEKYRELEIEELIENREFEEIFKKYGPKIYNLFLPEMNLKENFDEFGEERIDKGIYFRYRTFELAKYLAFVSICVAIGFPTIVNPTAHAISTAISSIIHRDKIEEYNEEIDEYAKYIKSLGLNDLETIMKVIDDNWNKIYKFNNSESEIYGYFRINMMDEKPIVLCRHIADDVGAKLNAINPEYNARDINVILDTSKSPAVPGDLADTVTKKTEEYRNGNHNNSSITSVGFSNIQTIQIDPQEIITNIIGNHMVLFVDIKDDNVTLVVDPTMPGIGVYNNGEIYMFSTADGKGYTAPFFEQYIYGPAREIDYLQIKSMSYNYNEIEELNKKWGFDACYNALNSARDIADKASQNGYSYTKK